MEFLPTSVGLRDTIIGTFNRLKEVTTSAFDWLKETVRPALASALPTRMMLLGILKNNPITVLLSSVLIGSFFATHLFNPTDPNNVFFKISTRGKCDRDLSVKNLEAIEFNPNIPTYVLIHGYPFFKKNKSNIQDLRNSFLRREDSNVIAVDYLELSNLNYPSKAKIMPVVVGRKIASLLKELQKEKGLNLNTTNLIGFSIGAHIAGVVGKEVDGIGTITALDPAGPWFGDDSPEADRRRLNKTDAKRVIVHSTNGRGLTRLGHRGDLGHVNIIYNGGKSQPGCVGDSCHHKRAVSYFNSSICGPDVLLYNTPEKANYFECEDGIPFSRVSGQLIGTFFVNTTEEYPYFRTQRPFYSMGCRRCTPPRSSQLGTRAKCLPPDSVCVPSKTN